MLTARVNGAEVQLVKGESALAHLETLQAQSTAAYSLYAAFLARAKETDASLLFPSTDVRVVSRATVPTRTSFPSNKATLTVSAVISLLLAGGLGFLVESRRKGLVSSNEVDAFFNLPTLGMIPTLEPRHAGVNRDAIENLLNRIYFGLQAKSVLITSALPNEGKTSISKALADAAAARGLNVLLIDGDLRTTRENPEATARQAGFAEVLRGDVEPTTALQPSKDSPLMVMASGITRDNPIRLLSLPAAQHIFKDLEERFDLILIDAPPVMVGGDCWMLARHVDRTVLVVKWASTTEREINHALKLLSDPSHDSRMAPHSVSGIVLNMVDRSKSRKLDTADSAMFAPSVLRYYQKGSA
jgi:capsular exopolysaccharide synthesis family protein